MRTDTMRGRNLSEPQFLDCARTTAQSKNYGSAYRCHLPSAILSTVCRLCFWFACLLAMIGVAWRPPLASVGLIAIFLMLLVALEWVSRRWTAKKTSPTSLSPLPKSDTVQQQITRTRTAEGLDRLNGTFWAEFPADALTTTVHIPFCPAFERVPNVQVLPVDNTDASVRIVSSKTFGVRVDVKRNSFQRDWKGERLCFTIVATAITEPDV